MFCRPTGQPLHAAGAPYRPLHVTRHTHASPLLSVGADLRVVQQVLGHTQVALTGDTYTHVLPALSRATAARLNAVLPPLPSPAVSPPQCVRDPRALPTPSHGLERSSGPRRGCCTRAVGADAATQIGIKIGINRRPRPRV